MVGTAVVPRAFHRSIWLGVACMLPALAVAWQHSVDDAFITARYATRLFDGLGYTFNEGVVSDGVTGPAWLAPMWLGAALGIPLRAAKIAGAVCMLISVAWVLQVARGRQLGRRACLLLCLACALSVPLAVWAVAGLETGLATLCATAMMLGATRRPAPSACAVGVGAAVSAWTRLELALLAAGCLAICALRDRSAGARALAWAVGGAASVLLFRQIMFGDWLPLSARAKSPQLAVGLSYTFRSWLGALGLPGALAAAWLLASGRLDVRVWLGLSALHGLALILAGGDWMPAARLWVPVLPVSFMAVSLAAARRLHRRRAWVRVFAATWLLWLAGVMARELPAVRAAGQARVRQSQRLAELIAQSPGPVAMVDVGFVGWALPEMAFVDLAGLTDPQVARMPGGHLNKRLPAGWLQDQAPCQLLVHTRRSPALDEAGRLRSRPASGVEVRAAQDGWIRARFRVTDVLRYAPDYHYVLMRRSPSTSGLKFDTCGSTVRDPGVRWHH